MTSLVTSPPGQWVDDVAGLMILLVTSPRDEHAQRVLAELHSMGVECCLFDLTEFPEQIELVLRYSGERGSQSLLRWGGTRTIDLADVTAIWWRRPQPFGIASTIARPSHRAFAYNESHEAFAGLWQTIPTFWVNHPSRDEVAARKAYQLKVAHEAGLSIPDSVITNDPEEARRFIERLGYDKTVYKAFSAMEHEWRETRVLHAEEMPMLANVRHAPVIFQEYVSARCDVRVTIVGHEMFGAAIYAGDTRYPVDFRIDMNAARVEPLELPARTTAQLRALMRCLGLAYGAVDMRLTPEGEFVFLEINPAGQWLFVEQRTRQPIARSVARLLADGHRGGP